MLNQKKTTYTIRSVANALDIMEQFKGDVAELGITDLSRRLRISKNNVFRLLATLQSRNYVEQNASSEKFRLGFRTVTLGQKVSRQLDILKKSRLTMETMVRESNETVCISIMRNFSVINLDAVECDHPLRVDPRIGSQLPLYCTAAGKALLAHYSEEQLGKIVSNSKFRQYTDNTIIDPKHFRQDLRQVTQNGFALELEELYPGVICIAATIRDYTSTIVGAVSCLGPANRFADQRMRSELIPLVTRGAADISARLGYY